jgi:hypothetical protein
LEDAQRAKTGEIQLRGLEKSRERRRRELERQVAAGEQRLEELDLLMAQCGSDHVRLAELFEEKEQLENQLLDFYDQQEKLDAETEET